MDASGKLEGRVFGLRGRLQARSPSWEKGPIMSKRVGLCVGFVLAILSVAATPSCSAPAAPNGAGGSSGSSASSGSSGTSGSSGSSGTTPVQDIAESEPNNGPDMAGMQNVGVIDGSKTLRIKGRLDSGGMNATAYTGDFDGFAFEIKSAGGSLSTTVDWTGSADVDAILYDSNLNALAGDNTAAKPISQSAPIPAGKYALVLFSKDQPADWTLTFAYGTTPPGSSGSSGTSRRSRTSRTRSRSAGRR